MPADDPREVAPLYSRWQANWGKSQGQLYTVFEHTWNNHVGLQNCGTRRKHWVTLPGLTRKYVRSEEIELADGRFPVTAWKELFSQIPPYPVNLPDDLVREIANLALHVQRLAPELDAHLYKGDFMLTDMPLSLATGALNKVRDRVNEIRADGYDLMSADYLLDDGGS
jgi:hypothetical protein